MRIQDPIIIKIIQDVRVFMLSNFSSFLQIYLHMDLVNLILNYLCHKQCKCRHVFCLLSYQCVCTILGYSKDKVLCKYRLNNINFVVDFTWVREYEEYTNLALNNMYTDKLTQLSNTKHPISTDKKFILEFLNRLACCKANTIKNTFVKINEIATEVKLNLTVNFVRQTVINGFNFYLSQYLPKSNIDLILKYLFHSECDCFNIYCNNTNLTPVFVTIFFKRDINNTKYHLQVIRIKNYNYYLDFDSLKNLVAKHHIDIGNTPMYIKMRKYIRKSVQNKYKDFEIIDISKFDSTPNYLPMLDIIQGRKI